MAYRRMNRRLGRALLYLVLLSLMTPGVLLSLGMTLWWKLLGFNVALYPAGLGVQVAWAIPFGFLVMLAIFNRYDIAVEEAARDLGASAVQTFTRVTLPIIWGGVFGAALFGFTLSWNEFERTLLVSPTATLPLEIYGELISAPLQPYFYALGVITTFATIALVFAMLVGVALIIRRTTRAQAAALEEETPGAEPAIPTLALEGA
jgi:putative spermidine/putrescine transport system permease protein